MEALSQKAKDTHWELLAGVTTDLLCIDDPERLLDSVYRRVVNHSALDVCCSYLVQAGRLELVFAAGFPLHARSAMQTLEFGEGLCGRAADTRLTQNCERLSQSEEPATNSLRAAGVETFCSYPLLANGKLIGTLSFGSRRISAFGSEEFELQKAIANQVAIAFHRTLLLQELAENNQKLLTANAELRRAHAELEQIAFSASHDLREPVRHLSLYAELLERQLKPKLDDAATHYLHFLSDSAKRIERLVSDLRHYTGLGFEAPETEAVDTGRVAAEVCSILQPLVQKTNATVTLHELPPIRMAAVDLAALLENLIENAIVHHRSGVPPDIQVFSSASKIGPVICVRDNGLGIDRRYQDSIFGLFKRLHPKEGDESTGVGLTLCRKIVDRYKGQIWVESEPGKGALFCFALPQNYPAHATQLLAR